MVMPNNQEQVPTNGQEQQPNQPANSRFSDNPFWPPRAHMSPEQRDWIDKRDEAIRIFHATGDKTMAQEIGLFPSPKEEQELIAEQQGQQSETQPEVQPGNSVQDALQRARKAVPSVEK